MAYNDSGELPASQSTYSLGGYTFELKVQTVHEPGEEDVVSVYAICRGPDGTRETQAVDYPKGTTIENWRVEANETEATVYVKAKNSARYIPCEVGSSHIYYNSLKPKDPWIDSRQISANWLSSDVKFFVVDNGNDITQYAVRSEPFDIQSLPEFDDGIRREVTYHANYADYDGQRYYYYIDSGSPKIWVDSYSSPAIDFVPNSADLAYLAFGGIDYNDDKIVARFAIDIREADTDSWDEPGDDGPPGTTLNVTVTGATAGSCTGTPTDNDTIKGYGDGGDGGYGGGGGAGASTVIIYEFATSIAESVQQEAISRGPGTGGPGGKGGKGGDGCILIFY